MPATSGVHRRGRSRCVARAVPAHPRHHSAWPAPGPAGRGRAATERDGL